MTDYIDSEPSWNSKADTYRQLGDVLKVIAETADKVNIDPETHERWREILALVTEVDTFVDEQIFPGYATETDIVSELESFECFESRYPHISPDALTQDQWNGLESCARSIVSDFLELVTINNVDEYIAVRTHEAITTAELIRITATDHVLEQSRFHDSFMPRLARYATSSSLLDSVVDLTQDYKSGKTLLRPTIRNRITLFSAASKDMLSEPKLLLHPAVTLQLGGTALDFIGRKFSR